MIRYKYIVQHTYTRPPATNPHDSFGRSTSDTYSNDTFTMANVCVSVSLIMSVYVLLMNSNGISAKNERKVYP